MADNVKKAIVLDFFGMPACGKSTVSHIVAEALRKKGYLVYEPSYVIDHNLSVTRRKLSKFWQYIRFSFCHFEQSKKVYLLVKENGYKSFSECLSQCVNIVSKYSAVKKKSFEYIVFDEGFCQAAISLSFNKDSHKGAVSNYKKICEIYGDVLNLKPVYLNSEVAIALKNMKNRGGHDSRVDAETNDTKRIEKLCDFYKLCCSMKEIAFIVQATQNDAHMLAEKILKKILVRVL